MTGTVMPRTRPQRRFSRAEAVLLGVALALSLAILVGAFVVPIGSETSDPADHGSSHVVATTVADESGRAVLWCLLPLLATLVVGAVIRRRGGPRVLVAGWIAVGVLGLAMLAAILTIGFTFLPVAVCLVVALALRASRLDPPVADHSIRDGAPGAPAPPPA